LRRHRVLFARSERERPHGFVADWLFFGRQVYTSGLRRLWTSRLVCSRRVYAEGEREVFTRLILRYERPAAEHLSSPRGQ
jgi:hypothetical protein